MLSSPSQAAPDNLIDEFDRATCDDDPPSDASSPLVPGPQRTLVRIAIDRGESFFKARRPKQIDTSLLNTVVARERHARRGVKRAGPFLFLKASAPHPPAPRRRRRSSTATRSWPWLLLASCAVLLGRSLAFAQHAGGDARTSSAAAVAGWSAVTGWSAASAPGPWVRPRPSPVQDMFTSGGAPGGRAALEGTASRGHARRSAYPGAARRGLARTMGPATGASRGSVRDGAFDVRVALPALVLVCFILGSLPFPLASALLLRASPRLALNVHVCAGWPTWVAYAARAGFARFGTGFGLVLRLLW